MFNIQLIGVKFVKSNQFGDFNWMCNQEEYSDSLFIFNDNEEYHDTCKGGAGNAVMRRYNKYSKLDKPKSAGIPTGTLQYGGYQSLDKNSVIQIDSAIGEIIELIIKYNYKQIYYSSELDGKLGTSIFAVDEKVIRYITHKLFSLTTNPIQIKIVKILPNYFFEDDFNTEIINSNNSDNFDIHMENSDN
jgi:hypothetical protein